MKRNQGRSRGGAPIISKNRRIILVISIVILVFVLFKSLGVLRDNQAENSRKAAEMDALNNQIEFEENKSAELKKNKNKEITDEDYEAYAREELGLIKKDEIVIKPR